MKIRWPRGRYNGDRIDGLEAKVSIHLLWWNWRPVIKWNLGAPYFHWLCFSLWTQTHYERSALWPQAQQPLEGRPWVKWLCKIIGHRWDSHGDLCGEWTCKRCEEIKPAIKWPRPPSPEQVRAYLEKHPELTRPL